MVVGFLDKTKIAVVLFSFGLLALLVLYADPQKLVDNLRKADVKFVLLALAAATGVILVHVLRFKLLLAGVGKISYLELFPIQMFGVALANITPGRAAEPTKALILKSTHGFPFTETFSKNMLERLGDMLVVVAFAFISLQYVNSPVFYAPVLFFALFVIAFIAVTQSKRMEKLVVRFARTMVKTVAGLLGKIRQKKLAEKISAVSEKNLDKITGLFDGLKLTRNFLLPLLLTVLIWVFSALVYFFAFESIGVDLAGLGVNNPLLFCMGAISLATLMGLISTLPGGTGAQEFSFSFLLMSVGVEKELAVSAVLLGRLLTFWFMVGTGLLSSLFMKKRESAIIKNKRAE